MLIHEEKAAYDIWIKLVFLIPVGFVIGAVILLVTDESIGSLVMFIDAVFLFLLFYFIMPRKYQIYEDRLKIVLGTPFTINILLSSVREIRRVSGSKAFIYSGVRFATSARCVVEISRRTGMNYVISPQNGDVFLDILNQVIRSRQR